MCAIGVYFVLADVIAKMADVIATIVCMFRQML